MGEARGFPGTAIRAFHPALYVIDLAGPALVEAQIDQIGGAPDRLSPAVFAPDTHVVSIDVPVAQRIERLASAHAGL